MGQSSIFLSKVPNCKNLKAKEKDTPGPGYYEKMKSDNDISVMSEGRKKNNDGGLSQGSEGFNTTNNALNK